MYLLGILSEDKRSARGEKITDSFIVHFKIREPYYMVSVLAALLDFSE